MFGKGLVSAAVVVGMALMGVSAGSSAVAAAAPGYTAVDTQVLAAPSKATCDKAVKLLTQVVRLAEKYKIKLSPKRKSELQAKINNGTITSNDLPGKIQSEFPGEFKGKTLNDIKKECGIK
ncbi:hypothetical protein [Nocardia fusca]|uniref:hypothetical protein n=1 Tax=Nocardia fusca TaxID=941183 RepID=UPI000A82AFED|nr:hypothetical protein [Nocardia fusca]